MSNCWEMTVGHAEPEIADFGSLAVADIDGDGAEEMVMGGTGGLIWYRPSTGEHGLISGGNFHVGVATADVDGDGALEVVAGYATEGQQHSLCCFKPTGSLDQPWQAHEIDVLGGGPHDVLCVDIDGDGVLEVVANACNPEPGLYIFKAGDDPTRRWNRYVIQEGLFREGTSIGDIDGDGQLEIVFSGDVYHAPAGGPLAGPWLRSHVACTFREMVRTALVDVTGTGRPDVIICESEYFDGRIAWVENRVVEDPQNPWIVHEIDRGLYYAHSLDVRRDESNGEVRLMVAEMAEGGWRAPRNYDARVMEYVSVNGGGDWSQEIIESGRGTHEAVWFDIDHDGEMEVVGKEWGNFQKTPRVQIWKKRLAPSPLTQYRHRMLDWDKPDSAIDIMSADLTGDGTADVICGSWWYRHGDWKRFTLPENFEAACAADIDGDGRAEIIGIKRTQRGYPGLNANLVYIKADDAVAGKWTEHAIGQGHGDWPHGLIVAPIGPGGRLVMIVGYHSATRDGTPPELFEIPDDPAAGPWPKRVLADIPYGEEFCIVDIDGDGLDDIVAGPWWLRNLGDGNFEPRRIAPEGLAVARVGIADINGDGRPDVILGEEVLDFENRVTPWSRLVWLENPAEATEGPWKMHVIDKVRCPHSIGVADLDGDGTLEIICGEHDPFRPYRTRCRMLIYKQADPAGLSWTQHVLDDRFEHHDGARVIELGDGRVGILSHGWTDNRYVHLWEPPAS